MTRNELGTGERYDVVVVGGGAAGLTAALVLARSRRSVLVVDNGRPRNAPAAHMHGYLSRDGVPPGELLTVGREEVAGYGGELVNGTAVAAARGEDGFTVELDDGRRVAARRLLVASGIVDELPDIEGLAARWGRDVLHCPYCHGWEVRDQRIGVLATDARRAHLTTLFRQWTDRLTLFLHTTEQPEETERERYAARGTSVVSGEVVAVETTDDRLSGVRLASGQLVPVDALAVGTRARIHAPVLTDLGVEVVPHPGGVGDHVPADATGRTGVPGVWVAGNVANPTAQVLAAANSGSLAGAMINADLVETETEAAVRARRGLTQVR